MHAQGIKIGNESTRLPAKGTHGDANKNKQILRISLVTGLFWFSLYTYVPILSPYAESLGASHQLVGMILGSYGLMQVVARIPFGLLSDSAQSKRVFIALGMVLSLISGLGMWFFSKPLMLLLFRALGGLAASTWVIFIIAFLGYFDETEILLAMGRLNFLNAAGQVVAMLLGGILAQDFGPKTTFLLGAIGAIVGLSLCKNFEFVRNNKSSGGNREELLTLGKDKKLLSVSFLAAIAQLVSFATVFGFTPVVAKRLGATDFALGLMMTSYILSVAFSSVLSGAFVSKSFGLRKSVVVGFTLVALSTLTIPYIKSPMLFIVIQFVSGLGQGIMFPLLMSLSVQHIAMAKRATAMGIFQAIYGLGIFAGPVIIGTVSSRAGLLWGFWLVGLLALLGAWVSFRVVVDKNCL